MEDELMETRRGGVATLTLNRPKVRNALNGRMLRGLIEALSRLAADPEVRVVVLTGAGGAFCAGGDVDMMNSSVDKAITPSDEKRSSPRPNPHGMTEMLRSTSEVSRLLYEMCKPTIAVIPGAAAGAGLSLALACDMRIATKSAKITTAFSKIGGSGDLGGSYFLTHLVGPLKARELYFFADVVSGQEAEALGIVNRAVDEDHFDEEVAAFVRRAENLPTVAIGFMKRNLNAARHATLSEVLDLEAAHMVRSMATEDHKIGVKAFMSRTTPEFTGR